MNLEDKIKDVINQKMTDGTVEKLVSNHFEKGITGALENLFSPYGDATKTIEKEVKSVMVPFLEGYDYSEFIVKLDSVLVDVLNNSALENKKLLENFKTVINFDGDKKSMSVDDLFEKYQDYVAKDVSVDGLEINHDEEPFYEAVPVQFDFTEEPRSSWMKIRYANLTFTNDADKSLNVHVRLRCFDDIDPDMWRIERADIMDISSLRHLNSFEVLLMQLSQNYIKLTVDDESGSEEVEVEESPEPSF